MRVLLLAIALFFFVHWAYVAIMAAKRAQLTAYWRVVLYPLAVVGLALDVAFNVTFGSAMYLELPREMLFTSRCKRHKRGDGWRKDLAAWFCQNLGVFDPGHC